MKWALLIAAVVVFIASLVTANYIQQLPSLSFAVPSPDEARKLDWLAIILQALCLIIGIIFSYAYKRLSDLRAKGVAEIDVPVEARAFVRSTNLWLALVAAPMIFGVVLALTGDMPLGTALFIAFQNGFFWEQVMPQKPFVAPPAVA